jgi:hypothetical protein
MKRNAYNALRGKKEGKRTLGREDNIKIDLREMVLGAKNWINLAHERDLLWALVNALMNLPVQ